MRRPIRALVALALVLTALAAVVGLATFLSPERLRSLAERQLSEATGSPATVGSVRVALGIGIQLAARDVALWPGPTGTGLYVDRLGIGLEPLSLLTGSLRPRRMILYGAELRIQRGREGRFEPPPFAFLDPHDDAQPRHPDELLAPLIALETGMRALLARPYLADAFRVRGGRVLFRDDTHHSSVSISVASAELRHRRLSGAAELEVRGGFSAGAGELSRFEWTGRRDRRGELQVALRVSDLDLASLTARRDDVALAGRASGELAFASREPGHGRLELDFDLAALEARRPTHPDWAPLRTEQLDLRGALEITPGQVKLEAAHFGSPHLGFTLSGGIGRPLRPGSPADLQLRLHDLDIAEARAFLAWLPETRSGNLRTFVAPVVAGRLAAFAASGRAALGAWQEFLAGRASIVEMGLRAEAEFEEGVIAVGESDRIEAIAGRFVWSPDRVEVEGARATLNGQPLPQLDLRFDGISHLVAGDPSLRRLAARPPTLPGVATLWKTLASRPRSAPDPDRRVVLQLEVDWLHHPVFFWPLEKLRADLLFEKDGVRVELAEGQWAGVPIRGDAEWQLRPELRARFALRAGTPQSGPAPEPEAEKTSHWARGRFEVGAIEHERWRQTRASGRFTAAGGALQLHDVLAELSPAGQLTGSGSLELTDREAVPFLASAKLAGGDVAALTEQIAKGKRVATGRVDAWGSFDGRLRPETSPFADLGGLLELRASDGAIQRSLPPIVAIALASKSLNPFAQRDEIRYRSAVALLEFGGGGVSTQELSIEGPDMRMVASGSVDLVDRSHPLDAEVALFLFRQLDRAVGTIPVLNLLLLGADENWIAAYFRLSGPWGEPRSRIVPLKTIATGPASLVLDGVPTIVRSGLRALGAMFGAGREEGPASVDPGRTPDPSLVESPWES